MNCLPVQKRASDKTTMQEGLIPLSDKEALAKKKAPMTAGSYTTSQLHNLASRPGVHLYEVQYDKSRYRAPKPFQWQMDHKCRLRELYETQFLDFLPEASDRQLRRLVWEEFVQHDVGMSEYWTRYCSNSQGATCRDIVNDTFRKSLRTMVEFQRLTRECKGDTQAAKQQLMVWMQREKVYYSSRDTFAQIKNMEAVDMADADEVPKHLRDLLASRRAAGDRPGKGLLASMSSDEAAVIQRDKLIANYARETQGASASTTA